MQLVLIPCESLKSQEMSDSIEDKDKKRDADLEIDRNEFRKMQFDSFKHMFIDSFDEAGLGKLEHLTIDPSLKKSVINLTRRLHRARISFETLTSHEREPIEPFIEKMDEVFKQLIQYSKDSSEYSARNIPLPAYNRRDMELLLGRQETAGGEEEAQQQMEDVGDCDDDPVKWLCRSNEEYEKKITELLGAGELLMNEWQEIKACVKEV